MDEGESYRFNGEYSLHVCEGLSHICPKYFVPKHQGLSRVFFAYLENDFSRRSEKCFTMDTVVALWTCG